MLLYWNPKLTLSLDFVGSIREVFVTLKSTVGTKLVLVEFVWYRVFLEAIFEDYIIAVQELAHLAHLRYFVNTQPHKGRRPFLENFQPNVLPSYIPELKANALISNQGFEIRVVDLFLVN